MHGVRGKPRVGLALAGGGVLAAAHVGVLRALDEEGIVVQAVAGVSAGALIAALWADGRSWQDLLKLAREMRFGLLDPNPAALLLPWRRHAEPGFFRGERLVRMLERLFGGRNLEELERPCALVAADLLSGRTLAFASRPSLGDLPLAAYGERPSWHVGGSTAKVLRGSMAVPVLFPPVALGPYLLVDGGVVDHVPAWAVRALGADFVVGVDLSSWEVLRSREAEFSPVAVGARAIRLAQRSAHVGPGPDVLIAPEFPPNSSILDFRRIPQHFEAGYRAARAAIPKLKARLLGSELA